MVQIAKSGAALVTQLLLLGALFHAPRAYAEDAGSSDPDSSVVLDGMWSSLSELHTGSCTAKLSAFWVAGQLQEADYTLVFDFDAGCSRIDRRTASTGRVVTRIDRPEETIFHLAGSGIVEREPPRTEARVENEDPFDVRILGLISFGELMISNDDSTCRTWQRLRAHLDELAPPRVSAREQGLFAITWELTVPTGDRSHDGARYSLYRRVTLVDPGNRFLPIRTEIWNGAGPTREITGELYATTESKWGVIENVPVPTQCIYDILHSPKHAELRLDWTSVGAPVDLSAFTVEGLELPDDTVVVNERLGPPIIESMMSPSAPGARSGSWRWILTGVSIAALAAVFMAAAIRKTMRARRAS